MGRLFRTAVIIVMAAGLTSFQMEGRARHTKASAMYVNPVIDHDCPDPTVLDDRSRTGYFYAYSTRSSVEGKVRTLPVYRSKDLVNWEFVRDGFEGSKAPSWEPKGKLWAPDINYVDGHYVLYYAMGVWGNLTASASGVAVADSPTGPFVDKGMIVSCRNTGVLNSIDPVFFDDGNARYLFWGSLGDGSGIWCIRLSDDGLSVREGAKPVQVGASNLEGTYVCKRGGYYYLFASKGSCCERERSTYRMVVARSRSVAGPYVGPDGMDLTDKAYENVIMKSSPSRLFVGTGHDAQIITDDKGIDWMSFHSYWSGNEYTGRCMLLEQLVWDKDGWPHFEGTSPSEAHAAPRWKH